MTRIICLSDTHNYNEQIQVPDGDILLHAGDATMVGNKKELTKFVTWYASLPHKHKIWIAGNHDFGMDFDQSNYEVWCTRRMRRPHVLSEIREYILDLCNQLGVTYLNNSGVEIEGLKIWGSPDQPAFCGWAFNRSHKFLEEHWKTIPDDTNILITHTPAYGILDQLETEESVGDPALTKRIDELQNLKLHVFGHIHPSYGILEIGNTKHVNASILDDRYKVTNKSIEVEL